MTETHEMRDLRDENASLISQVNHLSEMLGQRREENAALLTLAKDAGDLLLCAHGCLRPGTWLHNKIFRFLNVKDGTS